MVVETNLSLPQKLKIQPKYLIKSRVNKYKHKQGSYEPIWKYQKEKTGKPKRTSQTKKNK